jgi:hypothetical protein
VTGHGEASLHSCDEGSIGREAADVGVASVGVEQRDAGAAGGEDLPSGHRNATGGTGVAGDLVGWCSWPRLAERRPDCMDRPHGGAGELKQGEDRQHGKELVVSVPAPGAVTPLGMPAPERGRAQLPDTQQPEAKDPAGRLPPCLPLAKAGRT